ncbi:MAG: prephenate dehydrogenase/arogenate dehydrogenase family protein [Candidatus Peribacteraceae bacterium]|nr:prephenate dehydrogenase/arogenate dehydrogenase family protein [Candidatus Peribacteraceae bacterium]
MSTNSSAPDENTVTVFGAEGDWGSTLVKHYEREERRVLRVDPKLESENMDQVEAARQASVLVFAVFPEQFNEIIAAIQSVLTENHRIIETTSVKQTIIPTLEKLDEIGISCAATHPMIASKMTTVRGQTALLMSCGENSEAALKDARDLFEKLEMIINDNVPLDEHDITNAPQQGMPHLTSLAYLAMLAELSRGGLNVNLMRSVATGNYRLYEASPWRSVRRPDISAALIESLLQTEDAIGALKAYRQALDDIIAAVEQGKLDEYVTAIMKEIDSDGAIRAEMLEKTNIILVRFGNLRKLSFRLHAKQDHPGLLFEILEKLFVEHGLNFNAIDSLPDPKTGGMMFDFGVKNVDQLSVPDIAASLRALGVEIDEEVTRG